MSEELDDQEYEEIDDGPDDIEEAFNDCVAAGKSEDETMIAMIEAGATFKNVRSRYNALMVENGFLDSKSEKNEIIESTLESVDLSSEEAFDAAVSSLTEKLKGVNEKSAAQSIRTYCRKNEIEYYKKPKGAGAGRSGITSKYHNWLVDKLPVTKEYVAKWIETEGTENTKRHAGAYQAMADLANRAYNKGAGKEAEAA